MRTVIRSRTYRRRNQDNINTSIESRNLPKVLIKSIKEEVSLLLSNSRDEKRNVSSLGKTCAACGKRNHFKASYKCKLQSVNSLADDYSSDSSESSSETIGTVTACEDQVVNLVDPGNQLIFCGMEI